MILISFIYSTSSVAMVDVVATVRKEASDRIAIFMIVCSFLFYGEFLVVR